MASAHDVARAMARRDAPFAMGGNYGGSQEDERAAKYSANASIDAYNFGKQQRIEQLAKNRRTTELFAADAPAAESPSRTIFGRSPKKALAGRTAADEVGGSARDGYGMYVENKALAAQNKDRKQPGAANDLLNWGSPSDGSRRDVGDERGASCSRRAQLGGSGGGGGGLTASEQYIENKLAAVRNKAAKGGGNPIEWRDCGASASQRPDTAAERARLVTAAQNFVDNKAAAIRNKASKQYANPLIGSVDE